jgi:hypothetical protein
MLEDHQLPEEIETVQMQDVELKYECEFRAGIRVGERSVHRPTERRCAEVCCKERLGGLDRSVSISPNLPSTQQHNTGSS